MSNLKNTILHKIKQDEIAIRPRWHFVLNTILFGAATWIVLLSFLYIFSLVWFFLRKNVSDVPALGVPSLWIVLYSMPWLLLLGALLFLLALYFLVRQFSFSYRQPLVYTILILVLVSIFGPYTIVRLHVHEQVESLTLRHELMLFSPLYRKYNVPLFTIGRVKDSSDTLIIRDRDGKEYTVETDDATVWYAKDVEVGDFIIVNGAVTKDSVTAKRIRVIER